MTDEQKETLKFYTTNDYLLINGLHSALHAKAETCRLSNCYFHIFPPFTTVLPHSSDLLPAYCFVLHANSEFFSAANLITA